MSRSTLVNCGTCGAVYDGATCFMECPHSKITFTFTTVAPKLHERYLEVQAAELRLEGLVLEVVRERRLTAGEIVRILIAITTRWAEYVVRGERHPEDPTKKADEA